MCRTCYYVKNMSKMIQIRNVPDGLHRRLKARAAMAGRSLSDYLLNEIRRAAERPSGLQAGPEGHFSGPLEGVTAA